MDSRANEIENGIQKDTNKVLMIGECEARATDEIGSQQQKLI